MAHSPEVFAKIENTLNILRNEQAHEFEFDMRNYGLRRGKGPYCRTAGCIAGASMLANRPAEYATYLNNSESFSGMEKLVLMAAQDLGFLNRPAALQLFAPLQFDLDTVTIEDAIAVLEHYRDTGEVDWAVTSVTMKSEN